MCGGPEQSNSSSRNQSGKKNMSTLTVETVDSFTSALDLAANGDLDGLRRLFELDSSTIVEVGFWFVRKKFAKLVVREKRTPLMVAATYGCFDVVKFIISQPQVDVNHCCGQDKWTALHCASSSGSSNAVDIIKVLLSVGADPNVEDANGLRPVDMIMVPPNFPGTRVFLEELLMTNSSKGFVGGRCLRVSVTSSSNSSPTLSSSQEIGSPYSPTETVSSPMANYSEAPTNLAPEKKEYPIDPSFPDIKNSIFLTDEFRMFSFKVRPCSRAYSHDWTECPFVHPGENARRRDPRKYHYSCMPCPDSRKGACRRGDMCEYAHGVFECWLHPAQYRTRLCKDGTSCARRVCFFAHKPDELRPLYLSTGSAVPSPRSTASSAGVMDMAAALSMFPGSPSHSMMSPAFNQPISPNANGVNHGAWTQPNVPTLHLPGSDLQSSRLRSSLCARDILPEDLHMLRDLDAQQLFLNDLTSHSQPRPNLASLNRSVLSKSWTPSNLEDLFSEEIASSPRYADQAMASGAFSPSQQSAVFNSIQQQQNMLSPINTNAYSRKNVGHPLIQAPFGVSSPGRMSPRSVDPSSPMSARQSAFSQLEKQQLQLRSLSSRELGSNNISFVGSPGNSWSKWGSPSGKADWSVNGDELGKLRSSSSIELKGNGEGPDVSWVQPIVKESPPEMKDKSAASVPVAANPSGEGSKSNTQVDALDHSVLGAWLEHMQLEQLIT